MIKTLEELKRFFENDDWLDERLKLICAEFMDGCCLDCVNDMDFCVDDKFCYLTWEEYLPHKVQLYSKKIPLDWLVKPENEVRKLIWEILDKERKKAERKKKQEEKKKEKAEKEKRWALYLELDKEFGKKK